MAGYKRLGDILTSEGVVTKDQLKEAVFLQKKDGGRIGEALIKLGYVSEDQIVVALSKQLAIPYITLSSGKLKSSLTKRTIFSLIVRFGLFPSFSFLLRNFGFLLPVRRCWVFTHFLSDDFYFLYWFPS